jgi:hypothetical protein
LWHGGVLEKCVAPRCDDMLAVFANVLSLGGFRK